MNDNEQSPQVEGTGREAEALRSPANESNQRQELAPLGTERQGDAGQIDGDTHVEDKAPVVEEPFVAAAPKHGRAAARKLRFRTARQICAEAPKETPWILKPWLAEGVTTEVIGLPKLAGKTTWVLHQVRAIVHGGTFLGEIAHKSPVVYLAEGPDISFVEALRDSGLDQCDDLHVIYKHECPTSSTSWEDTIEEAADTCIEVGAKLLVIDTASEFMGFKGDAENNASDVLAKFGIIKAVVAQRIGVLFVKHERKSGGDIVSAGRGSGAFEGAVDLIISIRRPSEAKDHTFRVVEAVGRLHTPPKTFVQLVDGHFLPRDEDDVKAAPADKAEAKVLSVVPFEEENALDREQLEPLTGFGKTKLAGVLDDLADKGKLNVIGTGGKGPNRFRYWQSAGEIVAAAPRPLRAAAPNAAMQAAFEPSPPPCLGGMEPRASHPEFLRMQDEDDPNQMKAGHGPSGLSEMCMLCDFQQRCTNMYRAIAAMKNGADAVPAAMPGAKEQQ